MRQYIYKVVILFVLLFIFNNNKGYTQSIDFEDFHIKKSEQLSNSHFDQLQDIGYELKDQIIANLKSRKYKLLLPRKSKIKLERVELNDVGIDYDRNADLFVFGKLFREDQNVTINTYLYSTKNGITTLHSPLKVHTINSKISNLNDKNEISEKAQEIVADLFPNNAQKSKKLPITKPVPSVRLKKQKTGKTPAFIAIGTGALMGGTGALLRSKALKIYDDEYRVSSNDLDLLTKARKPNRQAHIISAAGLLTAGVGVFLLIKKAKNDRISSRNTDNMDFRRVQITPQMEYNIGTHANTFAAKMTYQF